MPVAGLTSKAYAAELREGIDRFRARPSDEVAPGKPRIYESPDTTHFSVMDRFGNAVTNTYRLVGGDATSGCPTSCASRSGSRRTRSGCSQPRDTTWS